MSKRIIDTTCPECNKAIQVPLEVKEPPTLDQISTALKESLKGQLSTADIEKVVQEQLSGLKPPKPHTFGDHKTGDELLDCPECRKQFQETGKKWKVTFPGLEAQEPKKPKFTVLMPKE